MPQRILLVEDEAHLATGLKLNLELEGYSVSIAKNAKEAREHLLDPRGYDSILLDIMLPDLDGFELCKRLRDAGNFTPVLMLTAKSSAEDRVHGLEVGADDYLVKPFELDELLARVRSMLRRANWNQRNDRVPTFVTIGRARIDFEAHQAWSIVQDGGGNESVEPLHLTRLEFDLLRYFLEHPGKVLSRDHLLEAVWKLRNYSTARTVDNFVGRLRKYIEEDAQEPKILVSVRGAGYRFEP